jgi:hypothetical protein
MLFCSLNFTLLKHLDLIECQIVQLFYSLLLEIFDLINVILFSLSTFRSSISKSMSDPSPMCPLRVFSSVYSSHHNTSISRLVDPNSIPQLSCPIIIFASCFVCSQSAKSLYSLNDTKSYSRTNLHRWAKSNDKPFRKVLF